VGYGISGVTDMGLREWDVGYRFWIGSDWTKKEGGGGGGVGP